MSHLELQIHEAIGRVDDPEYPGISIVDLGLLENIFISEDDAVVVGLIPTFGGCPALSMIADEVSESVAKVDGVGSVEVRWLKTPIWDITRVSADARALLASEFTVAVKIGAKPPACPLCGAPTRQLSMFVPSRCRAINRCDSCAETIEVMRS